MRLISNSTVFVLATLCLSACSDEAASPTQVGGSAVPGLPATASPLAAGQVATEVPAPVQPAIPQVPAGPAGTPVAAPAAVAPAAAAPAAVVPDAPTVVPAGEAPEGVPAVPAPEPVVDMPPATPVVAEAPMPDPAVVAPPAPEEITVESFAGQKNDNGFALLDSFMMVPCAQLDRYACHTVEPNTCPSNRGAIVEERGHVFLETFQLGGDPDKTYDFTLKVNGVLEGKYYVEGDRRQGNNYDGSDGNDGIDTLYVGGKPIPSAYNVFKVSIFDAAYDPDNNDNPLQHFYLNSFPERSGFEAHRTFALSYEFEVKGVAGGSVVEFLTQDSNCHAIRNCGPGVNNSNGCPAPREIPNEPNLEIPDTFGGGPTPDQAQLAHITVTAVSEAQ